MSRWIKNKNGILIPNREAGFIQPGIGLMNKKQGGGGNGDPYWSNVKSLLYFNGVNGSTVITDQVTGVNWSAGAGSSISTAQMLFGYPSLLVGTGAISTANINAIGAQDFTFEAFVNTSSSTANQVITKILPTWPNFVIYNNNIQFSNGGSWIYGSSVTIVTNQFIHYAVCRVANIIYLFVNGVLKGTGSITSSATAGTYNVGADQSSNYIRGYMAQVRLTVGKGRYTTSFTPPSAPFPNHA